MSKALIEAYSDAVWNKKQLEVIPRVVSNDVVIHGALGTFFGSKAMHHIVSTWISACPDIHVAIKHSIADKDLIVTHISATGTHKGEFLQIPASHNTINFNGVAIYRMSNSMITEYWSYVDFHKIRKQMLKENCAED